IKAFEMPARSKGSNKTSRKKNKRNYQSDWHEFIRETYGCLADDPIERGDQGTFDFFESGEIK
ncbi:MAG: hypothetical protein ACE5I1_28075, partial [bacterium]